MGTENIKSKIIKIISIDVANKSLAIACIKYMDNKLILKNLLKNLSQCSDETNILSLLNKISIIMDNINIKQLKVVDLLPGKKVHDVSLIDRTYVLNEFLSQFTNDLIKNKWLDTDVHLIIEYQMGPNRKSGDAQAQIIYHFSQYLPLQNVHVVGPSLKNKLRYPKDHQSLHNFYVEKYQTLYAANKAHTRYLLLTWLKNNKQLEKLQHINKKNYSDIADAFCQAIAWIRTY